jgi:uncharacterized short protein YbdD (DUF466 family)
VTGVRRAAALRRAPAPWWTAAGAQRRLRMLLRAVRQIVGAPDYQRYLEHHAAAHPGRLPLTAREYYADFVSRRFGSGPTCCC